MSLFDKDLVERKLYIELCTDLIRPFVKNIAAASIDNFNTRVDHLLKKREGHGFCLDNIDFPTYIDSIKNILKSEFNPYKLYITDIYQIVNTTTFCLKIAINYSYYPAQPPEVVQKYLNITKVHNEELYNAYVNESKNFQSCMETMLGYRLIPAFDHIVISIDPFLLTVK